jgi:hypothetical protein
MPAQLPHRELEHQLKLVGAFHPVKALFTHPVSLDVALDAAKRIGLPADRVFLVDDAPGKAQQLSVSALMKKHAKVTSLPKRRKWAKGEGKKKIAIIVRQAAFVSLCSLSRSHHPVERRDRPKCVCAGPRTCLRLKAGAGHRLAACFAHREQATPRRSSRLTCPRQM